MSRIDLEWTTHLFCTQITINLQKRLPVHLLTIGSVSTETKAKHRTTNKLKRWPHQDGKPSLTTQRDLKQVLFFIIFQCRLNRYNGALTRCIFFVVFFWAPAMKWGLVIAGIADINRPAEKVSSRCSSPISSNVSNDSLQLKQLKIDFTSSECG